MGSLRHALVLALVRMAPIRDRRAWFLVSMLVTAFVGGSLPALADLAPTAALAPPGPWIPDAGPDRPAAEPLSGATRVAETWPAADWVVGADSPGWTGLMDAPSDNTVAHVVPEDAVAGARPGLRVSGDTDAAASDARTLLRGVRRVADAEARAQLGVTADPRRAISVTFVDVPRTPAKRLPSPDGMGALLLGVGLIHGLGLLAAGLPRWRSRGFHAALRVAPVRPGAVLFGGLLAAALGGGLASGVALLGWALNAAWQGTPLPLEAHHALVPLALVPGLALAQRAFLTAPDTRTAGFRVVALQMALGVLAVGWIVAVAYGGLVAGAAVPFLGLGALATGVAPVQPASLAVGLASAAVTSAGVLAWGAHVLANDPVEAGDPTLRRRARGNHLPEVVLLLLLAVGGTTTFTLPLQRWGAAAGLLVGQVGFLLVPSLVMPLALSRAPGPLLGLGRPSRRAALLAPVVAVGGVATSLLALQGSLALFGPQAVGEAEALGQQIMGIARGPGFVLLTLLPALCEEVLFRGAVLGLLRPRLPTWAAVLLQAVAFALLHGMLFRVGPTLALGLLLGLLRVRSGSIWPGVFVHALHNALLLGMTMLGLSELGGPAWAQGLGLGVAAVAGLVAAWRSADPRRISRAGSAR